MRFKTICILGGTGFVGRHIAHALANKDVHIRVLTAHRERNRHLLPIPNLQLVQADVHDRDSLARELDSADAVINLIGVLNDSSADGAGFQAAHVELPEKLTAVCRAVGVKRVLHMSALGASEDAPSGYQQSKGRGETQMLAAHSEALAVTIFRPSVVFGPEDSFLNTFATMLRFAPVLPLPTPHARFQPVFVSDVAQAFTTALERRDTFGQRYDLCGPSSYTLEALVRYCAKLMGLRRAIIGLPDRFSRLQARVMERVPGQPYTMDNYLSSQVDNVCHSNDLERLGINPTAVEAVVPSYIGERKMRMRYNTFRKRAGRD